MEYIINISKISNDYHRTFSFHWLADDRRHRRSSQLEEIPALGSIVADENNDHLPESTEPSAVASKDSENPDEDEDMEGMYLQLLNELLKEKALTNRRTNQSKLRLLWIKGICKIWK